MVHPLSSRRAYIKPLGVSSTGQTAVAAPSDPVAVKQDVARKLQIYGVVQALRRGRLPGNTQLDNALVVLRDLLTRWTETPQERVPKDPSIPSSEEGRAVMRDLRDVVETTRQILRHKNADEVVQDFIYHIFNIHISPSVLGIDLSERMDEAHEHGQTAVHHLRTLLRILLTNREARKLLSDSRLIVRDLFAQTAVAVAERTRPTALELEGLDDVAPAQDWPESVDSGEFLEPVPAETSFGLHGANGQEGLPVSIHVSEEKGTGPPSHESPSSDLKDKAADGEARKRPFSLNLKGRFQTLVSRVPSRRRARAEERLNEAKVFLDEEFPQERRDQFIWRLKKVVTECQSTPSYQASISWFLTVIQRYLSSAGALATSQVAHTTDLFTGDPILARAVSELRTIAERGAGGRSLSGVLGALQVLWEDARGDKEMSRWWDGVNTFVAKTLLEPGYITSTQFTSQSRKLRSTGRFFFTEKYKTHKDELVEAAETWCRAWTEDPLHLRFVDDWAKLVRDLLFDEKGRLVFKTPLWEDMRTGIIPGMLRQIGVIPIPRIEYIDDALEIVIENLTLQGTNLFPKTIEITAKHYSKLSPPFISTKDKNIHRTDITLKFSGIQADMRDVAFDYRRKSGIALGIGKIKDEGFADIFVGGKGITVKVKLSNPGTRAEARDKKSATKSVYDVKDVHVNVEGLRFTIRDSNHYFLYKALRPLVTRLIKQQIIKVFSDGIRTFFEYVDEQLAAARAGMTETRSSESASKRELLSQFWHTPSLRVKKNKKGSAFRVVPKHESALLQRQGHKKRWIRHQAEKSAQAAEEGIGWRSEAFNIVSPHTRTMS